MAAPNKVDSNISGLAIAEEASLKTLPGTPVWYAQEPNSYSDFGGSFVNVARNPINASRQMKKGVLTDLDASGGFNVDVTFGNLQRLLQGFFFADFREKADTAPFNGTAIAITGVDAGTDAYAAASGLDAFKANDLILASGFSEAANNGIDLIVSAVAASIVGTTAKTTEAAPPAAARLQVVGFQFPAGDVSLDASASNLRLSSVATDLTTLGLNEGEWIFIGGDAAANTFALNAPGYARIKTIASSYIDFDDTTFTPVDDAGATKLIRIFFGKVIKNEVSTLIKRRSYQLERQLGNDGDGIQSEILVGSFANELTLNIPQAEKMNADLSFVSVDYETRTGTEGLKAGTRISAVNEDAFNTSNDVYRLKMNIVGPVNINNPALFAYVTDANIAISNGVTPTKAIGVLGAFDTTAGDFVVSGNLTAYFSTTAAVAAIRNNSDVAFNAIFANNNNGFIFDIPLMSIGGGRLNVEKDAPITLPIEMNAAENSKNYTLLANFFSYLPSVAMPV